MLEWKIDRGVEDRIQYAMFCSCPWRTERVVGQGCKHFFVQVKLPNLIIGGER